MHIAVEMIELRITHIHPLADVVSGLVHLESAKLKHVRFEDTFDAAFLAGLTTLELDTLYRNATSANFPAGYDDRAKRECIAQLAQAMQPQTVNPDELRAQIEAVEAQLEAPVPTATQFKYVFGARVPATLETGLFPIAAEPFQADQYAALASVGVQRRSPAAATHTPAAARTAPQPAAKRPATAPTSGARPAIWAHADAVWEAAGKPANKNEVLALRKRMMNELEEQGIKKTTSSTALGDWMKARLD